MRIGPLLLRLLLCLPLLPLVVAAQTPPAVDQVDLLKRRQDLERLLNEAGQTGGEAPELFIEEMKDLGPQSILRVKPRRTWFEAAVDSQFFYTSNLLLQEAGNGVRLKDTSAFVNTAQLAFAPAALSLAGRPLEARLGYRHQWFNYGLEAASRGLGAFDFDVSAFFADFRHRLSDRLTLEAGADHVRLLNHTPDYGTYREIYREFLPRWGISWQHNFAESKVLTLGYRGAYHLSETPGNVPENQNNRLDTILLLAYTQALTPRLVVQPYYRLQHIYFDAPAFGRRTDWLQSFGLSLSYFFTDNLSTRVFAGYDVRESEQPLVADYRKLDAGLGLSFNLRF